MLADDRANATDRADAERRDAEDPLAGFRERFVFSDERIYLDGNSLGRLPRRTLTRLAEVVEQEWGTRLISSWSEGWLELPISVGDELAGAALGAAPGQVAVADSTTVCLYKLAAAALSARPGRCEIVTDAANFPTDRYVLESLAQAGGHTLRWIETDPAAGPTPAQVSEVVGSDTALVSLSHVAYRSAHLADMAAINELSRAAGALTLWDLSHSAGSVPVELDRWGSDLAVGCTYKYLNGGPGAPAFLYVRRDLQDGLRQPIWGWLGRQDPFAMGAGFQPASGIAGWLSGTPPILALAAVREGVSLLAEAGITAVREKGIALTELTIALADARLASYGVVVASPRAPEHRGAHVALAHPDAQRLSETLIDRGVVVDFRGPDVIRIGLSPLTTRFIDILDAVEVLADILSGG